jgi:hypothetical protein
MKPMSGGKIAIIGVLVVMALVIIGLMIDYYNCQNSDDGCDQKWWRFWMPKNEGYRRKKHRRVRLSSYTTRAPMQTAGYTIRPPRAPEPPIASTAGTNPILPVPRMLKGSGYRMI